MTASAGAPISIEARVRSAIGSLPIASFAWLAQSIVSVRCQGRTVPRKCPALLKSGRTLWLPAGNKLYLRGAGIFASRPREFFSARSLHVREFTVEPLYRVPERANLTDLVHRNAAELPQHAGLARKVDGRWADVTYAQFLAETQATAKGLVALGITPGDRVAIMSRTSYEWSLIDFAIWEAGAIPVPIYETSSAEQVAWILADSGAVAVFTELAANTAMVEAVRDQAGTLKNVWQIEPTGAEVPGAVAILAQAGA